MHTLAASFSQLLFVLNQNNFFRSMCLPPLVLSCLSKWISPSVEWSMGASITLGIAPQDLPTFVRGIHCLMPHTTKSHQISQDRRTGMSIAIQLSTRSVLQRLWC